jgi:hypothetical protein
MNGSELVGNGSGDSWREKARTAVAAGLAYYVLLLAAGIIFGAIGQLGLVPRVGAASALAVELTFMVPLAWLLSRLVARRFDIESAWPMGAIVAATTMVLVCVTDLGLLALLDPIEIKAVLNHGWIEARFVSQMLLSALPLAYQGR